MLTSLRRGLLAGAIGGVLAGVFGFLLAEPVMDHAVRLESARQAAAGEHTVQVFDRHTQHLGFLLATTLTGLALGVLFGVAYHLLHGQDGDAWGRALRLGGGAFFGLTLVPFLRYPSNPPGVGDPATIDTRTHLWLSSILIGLAGACFAGLIARGLKERGRSAPARQLSVVGVLAATIALTFVLPPNTDPIAVPVHLIWEFRLLSLSTLALLWGGLTASYGLIAERAQR